MEEDTPLRAVLRRNARKLSLDKADNAQQCSTESVKKVFTRFCKWIGEMFHCDPETHVVFVNKYPVSP